MAQVTLPYNLTPGTPENVNNLMSNLNALKDGVNTIDTAQIANGAVTAAKLAAGATDPADGAITAAKLADALANNVGVNKSGLTNRSAMTAMTTERTTTSTSFTDVTGASLSFTVASGSYILVGWNAQLKTGTSDQPAALKVLAGNAVCNPGDSAAGLGLCSAVTLTNSYTVLGGFASFSAAEIGTGSKTFKMQFRANLFGNSTAYVDEAYITVTQVTF